MRSEWQEFQWNYFLIFHSIQFNLHNKIHYRKSAPRILPQTTDQQKKLQYKFLLICYIFHITIHHNNEQVIGVCFHSIDFPFYFKGWKIFHFTQNTYFCLSLCLWVFFFFLLAFRRGKSGKITDYTQKIYLFYIWWWWGLHARFPSFCVLFFR